MAGAACCDGAAGGARSVGRRKMARLSKMIPRSLSALPTCHASDEAPVPSGGIGSEPQRVFARATLETIAWLASADAAHDTSTHTSARVTSTRGKGVRS